MGVRQAILLALQVSILSTVFGFGLKATIDDVLYLWRRPGLLLRSLVAMYVAMPLVALVLVGTLDLPLDVKIALVALSIAPLPPVLPSKLEKTGERGDYGIALMATLALLSIGITPLAVAFVGRYFDHPFAMSPATVAKTVTISIVLPLLLGMAARAVYAPVERAAGAVLACGKVLLYVAVLALVVDIAGRLWSVVGGATVAAIVGFVVAGLAIGHLLGGPDRHGRVTLALSSASRHPTIALAIASAAYPDERVGVTIVLYLLLGALVCMPYTIWQRRRHSADAAFA